MSQNTDFKQNFARKICNFNNTSQEKNKDPIIDLIFSFLKTKQPKSITIITKEDGTKVSVFGVLDRAQNQGLYS